MQVLGKTMVMAPGKRTIQIQENDWGGSELKEFIKLSSEFGPGFAVSLVFVMLFLRKDGGASPGCRACFWSVKGWHPLGLGLVVSRKRTDRPVSGLPQKRIIRSGETPKRASKTSWVI